MLNYKSSLPFIRGVLVSLHNYRRRYLTVLGQEHLDDALAAGAGAILLTSHLGYGGLVRELLDPDNQSIHVLRRENLRPKRHTRLEIWGRQKLGITVTDSGINRITTSLNLREVFRVLDGGKIIFTTADGMGTSRIIVSELAGVPAAFNGGIFSVARSRGTPLLPVFVLPRNPGSARLDLVIQPPLEIPNTSDTEADLKIAVDGFARAMSSLITTHPAIYEYRSRVKNTEISVAERYVKR